VIVPVDDKPTDPVPAFIAWFSTRLPAVVVSK
jgi:hypothetical protein